MQNQRPANITRKRLGRLLMGAACLFLLLIGRLFYIQIIDSENLQSLALSQWAREFTISAKRGDITDRNGKVLAQSASAATVVAAPMDVVGLNKITGDLENEIRRDAKSLSALLGLEESSVYSKLTNTARIKVTLAENVDAALAAQVQALGIRGLSVNTMETLAVDGRADAAEEQSLPCAVTVNPVEVVGLRTITTDRQEKLLQSATALAQVLDLDVDEVYRKITDTSKAQYILARQITLEKAREVRALKISGISINEDVVRAYPMGSFLTQVLGFTDISGQGQEGLEKSLDKYLAGTNGSIVSQVDGMSRQMENSEDEYIEAKDGYTVRLTVDYVLEAIAEKFAQQALEETEAKAVRCILMDPNTAEIYAMCNKPDFDLNAPPRDDLSELSRLMRNACVADAYEPGSTFKILTTAVALNEGVTTPDTTYTCTGSVLVDGDKIKCWRSGNPHGTQTLTQAVCNSCNPVFVNLALQLGTEKFYEKLNAFGIGQEVPVDLPGASAGQMIALKYVKNVDIARVGFGQSVSVSPVQLLTAACAAVNGGNLMKPYIVKEMIDSEGQTVAAYAPEVRGNPISKETSATMREILETAVRDGGGRNAYIPGYRVGGKTGTAQKYVNGKVSSNLHICSFLGFAPMDDPKLAILFIVDEPGVRPDYGSTVAAPYAKLVLEESLKYMGIQPVYGEGEEDLVQKTVQVPDVSGMSIQDASRAFTDAGLTSMSDGIGDKIVEQFPAAGSEVPYGSLVMLYTEQQLVPEGEPIEITEGEEDGETDNPENPTDPIEDSEEEVQYEYIEVPDVTGLSMIKANRLLRSQGLTMQISGSGLAVSQYPEAGTMLKKGEDGDSLKVKVTFQ